jgi:hypothetical protein
VPPRSVGARRALLNRIGIGRFRWTLGPRGFLAEYTLPLAGDPPPLGVRLRAIAAGVLEYRKFEPLLTRFEELAQRMR